MIALAQPLELLDRAMKYASFKEPDMISAKALMIMAQEILSKLNHAFGLPNVHFIVLRNARNYIDEIGRDQANLFAQLRVLIEFWRGFDSGQKGASLSYRSPTYWQKGYRFGSQC